MQRNWFACVAVLLLMVTTGCDNGLEVMRPGEDSTWRLVNPRPFDVQINDMWGTSTGRVMAVGANGVVMTREGDQWREAPRPTRTNIFDVHGCDWQHIWAVCQEGLLFFDGSRWELRQPAFRTWQDRIFCRAPSDVMLVTREGKSFHFDGQTWTRQDLPLQPSGASGAWLVGWSGGYTVIGKSGQSATWQGGQWGPAELVDSEVYLTHLVLHSMRTFRETENVPVAIGRSPNQNDRISSYQRYGLNEWSRTDAFSLAGVLLDVVTGIPDQDYFIVSRTTGQDTVRVQSSQGWNSPIDFPGLSKAVLRTFKNPFDYRDNRTHFVLAGSFSTFFAGTDATGIEQSIGGLPFAAATLQVWPNGDFSGLDFRTGLIHGRDGKVTLQNDVPTRDATALWGPTPDTIYTVGREGRILRLTPHTAPVVMPAPTTDYLTAIWGSGPDRIFAGGDEDFLAYDGSTWTAIATPAGFSCRQLQGTAAGDIFVLEGRFLWRWDGTVWTKAAIAGDEEWYRALSVAPDGNNVFVLADDYPGFDHISTIWRWTDDSWTKLDAVPQTTLDLIALRDDSVLVRTVDGYFLWQDGTWRALPGPSTDDGARTRSIYGGPEGGIYSIDDRRTIQYLDLGGTGLWQ